MVQAIRRWIHSRAEEPYVRPWGLSAPIAVLIVCLPLLRPLWDDPTAMSDNEQSRFATVQAIVEQQTLCIDGGSFHPSGSSVIRSAGTPAGTVRSYSAQPPVMAALLSGPYWVMHRLGIGFRSNLALSTYLLTLLGATLPVAVAGGMVYRLGRLFELPRHWRMILAFTAVFGSGLVSYATALNSHTPAAALILSACGCFYHAGTSRQRGQSHAWMALAGLSAGLAAVIDLGAVVFLFLLVFVITSMRWSVASKVGGVLWYVLGAMPPLALHLALTAPVTGDIRPGFLHPELQQHPLVAATQPTTAHAPDPDDTEDEAGSSKASIFAQRFIGGVIGSHGLFSHFPILLVSLAGIIVVLRRHWPIPTKTLAVVTVVGGLIIISAYAASDADWSQPMFATRWFMLFMPLAVLWAGPWLRKSHHPVTWTCAAILLSFSILTTLLGAAAPFAATREGEYTAVAAAKKVFGAARPVRPTTSPKVEGRE